MRAKGKKPAPSRGESSSSAAVGGIEARVDALAEILRRHELNEIEVEEGGVRIYVRRGGGDAALVHAAPMFHGAPGHAAPTPHAPAPTASGATPSLSSPSSSTVTGDGNGAYETS